MITKRIIPCLYVREGCILQRESLEGEKCTLVELAKYYSECGADELLFYDVTPSMTDRKRYLNVLREAASNIFIPLTVAGGVYKLGDFESALSCGADKVSVNSGAINNPSLIGEAAKKYGAQCVVLCVDVKKVNGEYRVFTEGGKADTGLNACEWMKRCAGEGAGEIVVNSVDFAGKKCGYDIALLKEVSSSVGVPVIASGGVGRIEDFVALFKEMPTIDAGLASSVFQIKEISMKNLKDTLAENGISVRKI